jgi:hypothetical protein
MQWANHVARKEAINALRILVGRTEKKVTVYEI